MIFPQSARYSEVMTKVNLLLAREDIKSIPIDPFQIIENNKWGLVTYTQLAQDLDVSIKEVEQALQSEDGYVMFNGDNYTIAYNDTVPVQGRIRFTLMHEIGHIYMGHLVDFDETVLSRSTLSEKKYRILENEANAFARNTLAPVMLIKDLKIDTIDDLVSYCGISYSAARTRLQALTIDYRILLARFVNFQRENFKSFVHSFLYSKKCIECNFQFAFYNAKHCPNCSSSNIINARGKKDLIYLGHYLDNSGRAKVCPMCDNEDLNYFGDYCKICGIYLINKCADTIKTGPSGIDYTEPSCETVLDGSSRYCMNCGNDSTFAQQELLLFWRTEQHETEKQRMP